jgi:hypothetical protein
MRGEQVAEADLGATVFAVLAEWQQPQFFTQATVLD